MSKFTPIPETTLAGLLKSRAVSEARENGFTFVRADDSTERLTYQRLFALAASQAQHLAQKAPRGSRALLVFPPGLEFIVAFFACRLSGIVPVPVSPPNPTRPKPGLDALESIIRSCAPTIGLSTPEIAKKFSIGRRLGLARRNPIIRKLYDSAASGEESALRALAGDILSTGPGWYGIDVSEATPPAIPKESEATAGHSASTASADDVAFLQFTSGSTSAPKGVIASEANVSASLRAMHESFGGTPEDIGVSWLPFGHNMGLLGGVLYPLFVGGDAVLTSPLDIISRPRRWLELMDRYGASFSAGPNRALQLVVDDLDRKDVVGLDLSNWKMAGVGGDLVDAATLEAFAALLAPTGFEPSALRVAFGMAESSLAVTVAPEGMLPMTVSLSREALRRNIVAPPTIDGDEIVYVSCGKPVSGAEVTIVDLTSDAPAPPGTIGEVWLSGAMIGQGYWNLPDETSATFGQRLEGTEKDHLRTGDLGFLSDGELVITGRCKEAIILFGHNHSPADLESTAILDTPDALSVAAFSTMILGQEGLGIAIELADPPPDGAATAAAIRKSLMVRQGVEPHAIILLAKGALPRTPSQKIQRLRCRELLAEPPAETLHIWIRDSSNSPAVVSAEPHPSAREGETSQAALQDMLGHLRRIAGKRLDIDPDKIDVNTPFQALGLTSLMLVSATEALSRVTERKLSPTEFFDHPTIASLARYLVDPSEVSRDLTATVTGHSGMVGHDVSIVGLSCRFPGARDKSTFSALLASGKSAIGMPPNDRSQIRVGNPPKSAAGYIENIAAFDPAVFGIAATEAWQMDPQHRLLLEETWKALEDAGIAPDALLGSRTGVFVGISSNDFGRFVATGSPRAQAGMHSGLGNAASVAAGRISFSFGLRGPCLAVDTACSSSLVALHQAIASLRKGEADLAIVAGVNAILSQEMFDYFSRLDALSPDAACRAFDEEANGYVRGEGCGVVVLKRTQDVEPKREREYGIIVGSATNHDGPSANLTAPNGRSQVAVITQALADAGLEPQSIEFVEAHGTGTPLGDPIEANAICDALALQTRETPLPIGAVKTAIGHLEAAAGIAGIIKVAIGLHTNSLAAGRSPSTISQFVSDKGLCFPDEPLRDIRHAGISSFGMSGTNCHVVVRKPDSPTRPVLRPAVIEANRVFAVSAASVATLRQLMTDFLSLARAGTISLDDFAALTIHGRSRLRHRVAIITEHDWELIDSLEQLVAGLPEPSDDLRIRAAASEIEWHVVAPTTNEHSENRLDPLSRSTTFLFDEDENWRKHFPKTDYAKALDSLPRYAFERTVHWPPDLTAGAGGNKIRPLAAMPDFDALSRRVRQSLMAEDVLAYEGMSEALGKYVLHRLLPSALERMGLPLRKDTDFLLDEQFAKLGIDKRYRTLVGALILRLAESEFVAGGKAAGSFKILKSLPAGPTLADLRARYPEAEHECAALDAVANTLPEILRGKRDPLDLFFGTKAKGNLEGIYARSVPTARANELIGEIIATFCSGEWVVDALEVGAGTGATTRAVIAATRTDQLKLTVTDVSATLVAQARKGITVGENINFAVLDIEREPTTQGLATSSFDVILAANVIHATSSVAESLSTLFSLLRPGGSLVFLEVTRPVVWLDIVFGLLPGWWRFTDHDIRPDGPLLPAEDWRRVLQTVGFESAIALPDRADAGLAILVARKPVSDSYSDERINGQLSTGEQVATQTFFDDTLPPKLAKRLLDCAAADPSGMAPRELARLYVEAVLSSAIGQTVELEPNLEVTAAGIDSLALVELHAAIERDFGQRIGGPSLLSIKQVSDLIEILCSAGRDSGFSATDQSLEEGVF